MNSNSTVSAELEPWLVTPQQAIAPLADRRFYSGGDPYAIHTAFHVGLTEPVEWTFARDLLTAGTELREGFGDVTLWPSAGVEGEAPGSVLNIEPSSPFGQAISRHRSPGSRTSRTVPTGSCRRARRATISTSSPT